MFARLEELLTHGVSASETIDYALVSRGWASFIDADIMGHVECTAATRKGHIAHVSRQRMFDSGDTIEFDTEVFASS